MDEDNKDVQEVTDSLQSMNTINESPDSEEVSKAIEKQKGE